MSLPSLDLRGRVALVTGAGSADGIGVASARLLASLGAAVALSATTDRVLVNNAGMTSRSAPATGPARRERHSPPRSRAGTTRWPATSTRRSRPPDGCCRR